MAVVRISVGDEHLGAEFDDNITARELLNRMPMDVPMLDLYGREMCHRYGTNALPVEDLRHDGYRVGDIVYWPPAGSLVILYRQNGERFARQQIGRIDRGAELFERTGDTTVRFERIDD
ncbi:cyclophilin-like fold protein [uncultured Propionibacterium sp.]|uniref:cyclophilin-like fold protein n=1 Tax=uncultured Propionibacterium sp. TaxID=218066 RepID=UPI00292CBE17|nr:cyclophilin-like fold protein [uncultured Propionibacterium sp.]